MLSMQNLTIMAPRLQSIVKLSGIPKPTTFSVLKALRLLSVSAQQQDREQISSDSSNLPVTECKYTDMYKRMRMKVLKAPLPENVDPKAIFANNELDLSEIDVYGFDYDYTLANYSPRLHDTIFEMGRNGLLETKKYPKALSKLKFDAEFAIRGLHFDLKTGLMMKLDAFHHIQRDTVYNGLTPVGWSKVFEIYGGYHVPVSKMNKFHGQARSDMHQFIDVFALPEMSLIAQVIEFFRVNRIDYDPEYVFWDVRNSIQKVHSSGQLHNHIKENLPVYLDKNDPATAAVSQMLRNLKKHGKTLFLITNSGFNFIDAGLKYLVGEDWQSLFDVVVINARKPDFFLTNRRPFRVYNPELDTFMWHRINKLEPGLVYTEGSLEDLTKSTGWHGSKVLYIGDHVYTDLADATLHHGWRTGAIIPELNREIHRLNTDEHKHIVMWMVALQSLIESHQSEMPSDLLREWESELSHTKKRAKQVFNPHFGSLFRTYHNPTYFSRRLHRFADIYTSASSNLTQYSVNHHFYPPRGLMSHEKLYPIPRL